MPGRSDLAQCLKCGLNFLNEEGLGKHTKRVHEGKDQIKPSKFKCDRCSDEFLVKEDFKKHKLPSEFDCELCKQKGELCILPTKCEYNFHIITHRTGKPKICENCGSEFKNNKNLKTHKEQDKTVSCRRCNKIFIGSCPLQKHIKTEHDTKNEPIPPLQRQYSGRPSYTRSHITKAIVPQKLDKEAHNPITKQQTCEIKTEPEDQKPAAKKQRGLVDKTEKKLGSTVTRVKNETPEPEETPHPDQTVPVTHHQFIISPEFMPGLCANESILGI